MISNQTYFSSYLTICPEPASIATNYSQEKSPPCQAGNDQIEKILRIYRARKNFEESRSNWRFSQAYDCLERLKKWFERRLFYPEGSQFLTNGTTNNGIFSVPSLPAHVYLHPQLHVKWRILCIPFEESATEHILRIRKWLHVFVSFFSQVSFEILFVVSICCSFCNRKKN